MKFKFGRRLFLMAGSLFLGLIMLSACSGSKSIQGTWQVQDGAGKNSTLTFKDKKMTLDGKTYDYKQNAVGFQNSVKYYGIQQDGKEYSIIFPDKDKNVALLLEPDSNDNYLKGSFLYAMNKKTTPSYKSYAKKYLNN